MAYILTSCFCSYVISSQKFFLTSQCELVDLSLFYLLTLLYFSSYHPFSPDIIFYIYFSLYPLSFSFTIMYATWGPGFLTKQICPQQTEERLAHHECSINYLINEWRIRFLYIETNETLRRGTGKIESIIKKEDISSILALGSKMVWRVRKSLEAAGTMGMLSFCWGQLWLPFIHSKSTGQPVSIWQSLHLSPASFVPIPHITLHKVALPSARE